MSSNENANLTDCPAAAPDFDFSPYLDVCRVCIVSNADVAGLGIIVGILLQAALMNFCVVLWWFAGPGLNGLCRDVPRLYNAIRSLLCNRQELHAMLKADFEKFGASVRAIDTRIAYHEKLSESRKGFRNKLQRLFKLWSDAQAITGIALLFAAILQNNGGDLSLYHTAIVLDLISVAADGQAIMLFYAFKTDTTRSSQVEERTSIPEPTTVNARPAIEEPGTTMREQLLSVDHGIWPRLVSSVIYLVLDFIFSFHAYFRFEGASECFLSAKPRTGNYGIWGIASAILVLCVYVPIFVPQEFLSILLENMGRSMKRKLEFLYPTPSAAENTHLKAHGISPLIRRQVKLLLAYVVWIIGRLFEWILKREIAFPVGTLTYILWNMIDIALLKLTNQVLLVGGGEDEKSFAAFGQIVPIVMVFAIAFPICDVM